MLEDAWHLEFPSGLPMWDSYPVFATKQKKEEKVGLAEAITSSILSTGRFANMSLMNVYFSVLFF